MAIVNLTPDSFSDGGVSDVQDGIQRAAEALEAGADILDLGAESTRPGAIPLSESDELDRLLPVLKVAVKWQIPISVDTYKPSVMRAALDAGADIINDIWALRWRDASGLNGETIVAAHPSCGVCLMHMHGEPLTMQVNPMSEPPATMPAAVASFLMARAETLLVHGVAGERIVVDPGIGFGKTVAQNYALLPGQQALSALGFPVLAGWSRKSALGAVTGRTVDERLSASVAASTIALTHGASVLRVHDVAATRDAVRVWLASQR
jgi:dihydropteroate synthase